jgi:general secretion pathway protein G
MNIRKAFTLVEILIVVIILAILATIALPRFSNASAMARASMMADDLRTIRSQMMVYRAQHSGSIAGYPAEGGAPSEAALVAQMTLSSNEMGETAQIGTPGYKFGPYLREFPVNPVNGKTSVNVLGDAEEMPGAPTGKFGWIYHPASNVLRADVPGADESGKVYYEY